MEQSKLDRIGELFGETLSSEGDWRIFYKGNPIITFSGKTSWSQEGHAKNALFAHISKFTFQKWDREEGSTYFFGMRDTKGEDSDRAVELGNRNLSGAYSGKSLGDMLLEAGAVEIVNTKTNG